VIISNKSNRAYNGLLNEIRKKFFKDFSVKDFRKMIKQMDPEYPINSDGTYISMTTITEVQLKKHMSFIKLFAYKRGYRVESLTEVENIIFLESKIDTRIIGMPVEEDGMYTAVVVCSNCGMATKKGLTKNRLNQLRRIEKKEEAEQKGVNSFTCMCCYGKYGV